MLKLQRCLPHVIQHSSVLEKLKATWVCIKLLGSTSFSVDMHIRCHFTLFLCFCFLIKIKARSHSDMFQQNVFS